MSHFVGTDSEERDGNTKMSKSAGSTAKQVSAELRTIVRSAKPTFGEDRIQLCEGNQS
jgi:hypothetical protein